MATGPPPPSASAPTSSSSTSTRIRSTPAPAHPATSAPARARASRSTCRCPRAPARNVWLPLLEGTALPRAAEFAPQLVLVSAGFDAHRADPLAGCLLESSSFAAMARLLRDFAAEHGAPLGAVLEGGYHPPSLVESLLATTAALGEPA